MYVYDEHDEKLLQERVAQFAEQMQRYLDGKLTEEEFLPLRLQNGLYRQRYAPMYRIAVPYGMMNSERLRKLAHVARVYDKGVAHVTTRQNFQLNWTKFEECPQILSELAEVGMHSIQTSGNVVRNTTTDEYAGVLPDEVTDPRPYAELIRQWSTFHPEFSFLPRKFKICINADPVDRAALTINDIGINIRRNEQGELGYRIFVGGGLGRTPMVGEVINDFVPELDLLTYISAILRVYNQFGRRDNKFKARIKILVKALGVERYKEMVEAEWLRTRDSEDKLTAEEINRVKRHFTSPDYLELENGPIELQNARLEDKDFARWLGTNVREHKQAGYAIVTLPLKKTGFIPGDITSEQMEALADIADEYSFGETRNTHQQNMVLADVEQRKLYELWKKLTPLGLTVPNLDLLTDVICCSGGDYCALANAKSIPVA
ncbi:MAG TPA: nitrite/sulfite reductase, partial [Pseudomonadales bacterium]|nr:nitrite/sulfite reductase [Pseudomonadales bacterium]